MSQKKQCWWNAGSCCTESEAPLGISNLLEFYTIEKTPFMRFLCNLKNKSSKFLMILMCLSCIEAFAQETPSTSTGEGTTQEASSEGSSESVPIESDWSGTVPSLYNKGDQTFVIALGVVIPTLFQGNSTILDNNIGVGGTGYLNYNYFFTSGFSVGGELGGMYAATLGKNMLYIVPFGVRLGYQFVAGRFEFPFAITIGAAGQGYLDEGYFGLFIKPAVSVYWRFNPEWSFGLNSEWWWVPQWTSKSEESVIGNFLGITLAARYHF